MPKTGYLSEDGQVALALCSAFALGRGEPAPFAPIQFYRASTGDFVGGNFWDERATGFVTGNPAADQALGPPLNPVEMANPDAACVVYHLSLSQYRPLFEQVWGPQSFAINWPSELIFSDCTNWFCKSRRSL